MEACHGYHKNGLCRVNLDLASNEFLSSFIEFFYQIPAYIKIFYHYIIPNYAGNDRRSSPKMCNTKIADLLKSGSHLSCLPLNFGKFQNSCSKEYL